MAKDNNCWCGGDNIEKENCCTDSYKEESCCGEHMHEDACECGCGNDYEYESDKDTMHVTFDDGVEKECLVLDIVEIVGKEYIALLPEGEEEFYLYGYSEDENGVELLAIESDEEFNKVVSEFEKLYGEEL